ncbi:MAG: hypothetical protein ACD_50C00064G0008 [uncultured bacterium]|nr:MAG: hypothetical protein ACD_50C00064G0008 [uncultured bacterium]
MSILKIQNQKMKESIIIPNEYVRKIELMHGEEGKTWLESLPETVEEYAHKWSLKLGHPFPYATFNYAVPAEKQDGTTVVLKIGYPTDREFRSELEALKVFNGRGSIQLLESDDDKNAILIERAIPGAPLTSVKNDEEEMSIAATIMKNLWQPVPSGHQFHSVSDWGKGFEKMKEYFKEKPNPLPKELVDKAERLFTGLSASQGEQVLLHGDLNHSNILSAQREPWLAIDPKGVIGEREYEIGVLLRNPQPELLRLPDPKEVLERRIDQLANELNLDRERTHGWGIAQAVLSAWWIIEDNGNDWEDAIACAEILNQIKIQT